MLPPNPRLIYLALSICLASSCQGQQSDRNEQTEGGNSTPLVFAEPLPEHDRIGDFIVDLFEDSKGNIWIGTVQYGVACYDGQTLRYFTVEDGLPSNSVVGIAEDRTGMLWFATHNGLSRYDGKNFQNYSRADGLPHERVSQVLFAPDGKLWIGTWGGVCSLDLGNIEVLELPLPDIELKSYQNTMHWVTDLVIDRNGDLWVSRDGYGICRYNGQNFRLYTKEDGLPSNNVQELIQDSQGRIWAGTRATERDSPVPEEREIGESGLALLKGDRFEQFLNVDGLYQNDIYKIYEDRDQNIWISCIDHGVYRFSDDGFRLFSEVEGPEMIRGFAMQSTLHDSKGRLWMGFSGGLYRMEDSRLLHIGRNGPW